MPDNNPKAERGEMFAETPLTPEQQKMLEGMEEGMDKADLNDHPVQDSARVLPEEIEWGVLRAEGPMFPDDGFDKLNDDKGMF